MKTKEVKRENLAIGGEYYDISDNGQKMFYLGIFTGDGENESRFFYSPENDGYDTDLDGTIPFCINGSPFHEEIKE